MLAMIVSYIFHPVLMPLVMTVALTIISPDIFAGISPKQMGLWYATIALNAVFFPLVSIALMKPLGFINSFHMKTAKERTIPLMVSMIFYFWVSHAFNGMTGVAVPLILKILLLGNFWGIILLFIINIFTKISMHTAAAGGMVGIMTILLITSKVNMMVPFFIAIVIAGIIGSARLIVGAHQKGDVWLGYIIGFLVQLGAFMYMK